MQPSDSMHKLGSIMRITMHNFVTYTFAEFFPGPQLNVILGPNGTGKSSIVCAIVLGVGGGVEILGRGKSPNDFIKHGCNHAIIETELNGGDQGNIIISRKIMKDSSSWKLNGRVVTKKEITDLTRRLNIQVDNLCQFLPQDKVASFSSMDSIQLLKETEKAVGGNQLLELHNRLIELKREKNQNDTDFESLEKEIHHLKEQNKNLEKSVERFREKEKCLADIDILKKKKLWVQADLKRQEAQDVKRVMKKLKKEYEGFEETEVKPVRAKKAEIEKQIVDIGKNSKDAVNEMRNIDAQIEGAKTKLKENFEKIDSLESDCVRFQRNIEDRDQKMKSLTKEIEKHESEYNSLLIKEEEYKAQEEKLESSYHDIVNYNADIQSKKRRIESELREFEKKKDANRKKQEHEKSRKESIYSTFGSDQKKAYKAIIQNRSKFAGKVCGPVCLEISTSTVQFSKYMNSVIPRGTMYSYVVEKAEDRDLVRSILSEYDKSIPILYLTIQNELAHPVPLETLKPLGITHYMDEIFEADPLVKKTVSLMHGLNSIAVGREDAKIEELTAYASKRLGDIITPSRRYTTLISQFSGEKSTTIKDIRKAETYKFAKVEQMDSNSQAKEDQRLAELKAEVDKLQHLITKSQGEIDANRSQLHQIKNRRSPRQLKVIINDKIKELESIKSEDQHSNLAQAKKKILAHKQDLFKISMNIHKSTMELVQKTMDLSGLSVKREQKRKIIDFYDSQIASILSKLNELKIRIQEASMHIKRLEGEFEALKKEAHRSCPLTPELSEAFKEYPDELDLIEDQIEVNQQKADACFTNKDEVERYEERRKRIAELEEKMNSEGDKITARQEAIDTYKSQWLPEIQRIVQGISEKFSQFFKEIGCMGDVILHMEEDDDFEKFGIEIWVTYRSSEPPRKLSALVQSGGERSVATMLYLIALQHLTHCPFRLVDEINQGMDPHNERMIFDLIAIQASLVDTPQYFLITPKLLPNLNFLENITVLCVFNGPWQPQKIDFNLL